MTHITVKNDEPSVIYRYTRGVPATVVAGVPARDLTEFDLAAMTPDQRLAVKFLSEEKGSAYAKAGRVPAGLSYESPPVTDEAPPTVEVETAAPAGKKDS